MQFFLYRCACGKEYLVGVYDVGIYVILSYPNKYVLGTFSGSPICMDMECRKDLEYANKQFFITEELDLVEVPADKEYFIFN